MPQTKVVLKRCEEYQLPQVKRAMGEILDSLGGISKFVKKGDRVLLKPNFLRYKPVENAVITHPVFIAAAAEMVRDAGGEIIVGDSPGIGDAFSIARKSGLTEHIKKLGGKIVDFSESVDVATPKHFTFKKFAVAKEVVESDVIINLPKIKTHGQMYLTLAVKNLFGCVVGKRKVQWHFMAGRDYHYFATMLVELHHIIRSSLTLVDGITAMEGNGPGSGTPRDIGVMIGGEDSVAVDAVICEILKADSRKLLTLTMAGKMNVGEAALKNILLEGDPLDSFRVKGFKMARTSTLETLGLPRFLGRHFKNALTNRPVVNKELCNLCQTCLENCPVEVISLEKGKKERITIAHRECIRCFCCQELCPEGAIRVEKGWLLKIADLFG